MSSVISIGNKTLTDMNDIVADINPPANPIEGSLWFNTNPSNTYMYNTMYVYTNGQWKVTNDYPNYVNSRGENLVTNGTGLLGNNYNFSSFAFDGSDAYSSKGSFKDASFTVTRTSDEIMPVDVSKRYKLFFMGEM
jgi:hypothetical protein